MNQVSETERILQENKRREKEMAAGFYSLEKPGNFFIHKQRKQKIESWFRKKNLLPLKGKKFLEIGCGSGNWLIDFKEWGIQESDIHGMELDEKKIRKSQITISESRSQTRGCFSVAVAE